MSAALASNVDLMLLDVGHSVSAFSVERKLATCFVQGAGLMATGDGPVDVIEFLEVARGQLGVEAVYFPLLYEDVQDAQALLSSNSGRMLRRRPSPVISWHDGGADVWDRCVRRLGSRARRRRTKFEGRRLQVRTVDGGLAADIVESIERSSWKAPLGQDMVSRGQIGFYRRLIETGEPLIRVAFDDERAVAYRLDLTVGRNIYCLKWSFDEQMRSVSPGFYLLAVDLAECYSTADVDAVDLFGAPDLLKDTLSTGERSRIDLVWPGGRVAASVLSERGAHDRINAAIHASGVGVRDAYVTHRSPSNPGEAQ